MKRSSTTTRKLRGNPGGKKILPEIAGVGDVWSPPLWFRKAHREQWDYAIANAPRNLLTGTDKTTLEMWCVHAVAYADATRALMKEKDTIIETTNGILVPHPLVGIQRKHGEILLKLSDKLGFNPSARASLSQRGAAIVSGITLIEGSVASYLEESVPTFDA